MMLLQYSAQQNFSTVFQSFVGGEGSEVAAGSMLQSAVTSCIHAPAERGHLAAFFPAAAGWCASAEQSAAATSVSSTTGDAFVSPSGLHSCSRGRRALPLEHEPLSSDQLPEARMFFTGSAPPPPGAAHQQQQQKSFTGGTISQQQQKSSTGGTISSSLHMGRRVNTRLRPAPASVPPTVPQGEGPTESGRKQFSSGLYGRTTHPSRDVQSRKRRQGAIVYGGEDAESESAVDKGRADDDQRGRVYPPGRQPFKHLRGESRTRLDSFGDGRSPRGRDKREHHGGGSTAPLGLPAPPPNNGKSFTALRVAGNSCQPQPSPPPPPNEDRVNYAKEAPTRSSGCKQLMPVNSTSASSQISAIERRRDNRIWHGSVPGCGRPPQRNGVVIRTSYSDQIIDNCSGLLCCKRLKAAFTSVAEVAGQADLIAPRYLSLTRRLPPFRRQLSHHHPIPAPPSATSASVAPAITALGDRRIYAESHVTKTENHINEVRSADMVVATSHSSSITRSSENISTVFEGWKSEVFAGGTGHANVKSDQGHFAVSGDIEQVQRLTDSGRQQIMQDEMSEVSSVGSDEEEMEDGEVAEAARNQIHLPEHLAASGPRLSQPDSVRPDDVISSASISRIPPWVSPARCGGVHATGTSSEQEMISVDRPSRFDRRLHVGRQSMSVVDSRQRQQQGSPDSLVSACERPMVRTSQGDNRSLESAQQHTLEICRLRTEDEGSSCCTSIQNSLSSTESKRWDPQSHSSKGADKSGGRAYTASISIMSASESSAELQNVVSSSSSITTNPQLGASSGGLPCKSQLGAASLVGPDSSGVTAVNAQNLLTPSARKLDDTQTKAGANPCLQGNFLQSKAASTGCGSSVASGGIAKPRPVDPRLTRHPKVQASQASTGASDIVVQDGKGISVVPTADSTGVGAFRTDRNESMTGAKSQPDIGVPTAQPSDTAKQLTSPLESSLSTKASEPVNDDADVELPRQYVCSVDGSRIELNPCKAPAPGVLPESLAGTCVARGKLPLLLDLDNTLLHAQAAAVTGCDVRLQDWLDKNGEPELFRFELSCNRKSYYMKLRPHLRTFLRVLEPYYEMSVYTNATQEYADIVVAILDENRQLFSDRIVARNSGFRGEASENKAVRRMYENMDKRCILAFDDRQNIWTDLPLSHVVKAQHYDFFDSHRADLNAYYPPLPSTGNNGCGLTGVEALGRISDEIGGGQELELFEESQQQLQGKSDQQPPKAFTAGKKPCDWDRHLDCMLKLFLHIHTEFFKNPAHANIGAILSAVQQSVLAGVGIFFTGYRKTYSPGAAVADCEERQAELAQRLGAKVYKRFDEEGVTHVVAGKNNTNNMLACRENMKLSRVHTLWLYCCEAALTRVPESAFEADVLCMYYENSPPTSPYRDHWMHLAEKDEKANGAKVGVTNSSETKIAASSEGGVTWFTATHQHHLLPPPDNLPVREFLGTGPYSDGATLTSPYEEIVFIWRPDKQTVRQLYGEEPRPAVAPLAPGTPNTGVPFNSINPNLGVLLAPGKPAIAGGTSNETSSTKHVGALDVRAPDMYGE